MEMGKRREGNIAGEIEAREREREHSEERVSARDSDPYARRS